jgi:hypothetical protein
VRLFKGSIWQTVWLVPSALWVWWGYVNQAHDIWTAGLSPPTWTAIGALVFLGTIIVLIARIESQARGHHRNAVGPPAPSSVGAIPTKKVFQNEELRVWDLPVRGDHVIRGKVFLDCIFYGPALIVLLNDTHIDGLTIDSTNVDDILVEVPINKLVVGAYGLENCRIERCAFRQIGIIGTARDLAMVRAAFRKT